LSFISKIRLTMKNDFSPTKYLLKSFKTSNEFEDSG